MCFALVVGLGHNGGGEEHVTQGTALVPVHLCLCTVLQGGEEGEMVKGEESMGEERCCERKKIDHRGGECKGCEKEKRGRER